MVAIGNFEVIKPSSDFEMVSGEIIRDYPTLVVGVYCKLLTFGSEWSMNIRSLSKELGISLDKTREAITMLEEGGYITRTAVQDESGKMKGWHYTIYGSPVETSERTNAGMSSYRVSQKPTTRFTDNTVFRTEREQKEEKTEEKESDIKKEKKEIEERKEKDADFTIVPSQLVGIVEKWLSYKKERRETYKPRGFEAMVKKLIDYSGGDAIEAEAIITNAMANNWSGFFPLKASNKAPQQYTNKRYW